jgi:hypothetical protein
LGLGTSSVTGWELTLGGATCQLRVVQPLLSNIYQLDVTSANEFVGATAVNGTVTVNLTNLILIPSGYVWRGVFSFPFTSGSVNWFPSITMATSSSSSISGSTLTIGGSTTGTFQIGQTISGTGVAANTVITAGSGTSFTISPAATQNISGAAINGNYTVKWDGSSAPLLTSGEVETVVISVIGGTPFIEVAALRGRL